MHNTVSMMNNTPSYISYKKILLLTRAYFYWSRLCTAKDYFCVYDDCIEMRLNAVDNRLKCILTRLFFLVMDDDESVVYQGPLLDLN